MSATPFPALGARSKSLVWGVSVVLVVESVALHALLLKRWPWLSVLLAAINGWTIWWLARDYRAVAERPTLVSEESLHVRLGRRAEAIIAWDTVLEAVRPTWQEIPGPVAKGYLKLSGSDDPNVLVRFSTPVAFTMMLGVRRNAEVVGLRLDAPDAFVDAVRSHLRRAGRA